MTVRELQELIADLPPDMEVILQKDSEGNGYSPLSSVDPESIYAAESTWHGEVYDARWSAYDAGMEDREWEQFKAEHPRCLVLAPVN